MLIENAALADGRVVDVRIEDEHIAAVGSSLEGDPTIDATGKLLLPGAIDAHVHFREPGPTHKEDWSTGSAAAVAGGVTTVFEMPNTDPTTTSPEALRSKRERASSKTRCNFGLFFGATTDNAGCYDEIENVPGLKIFMGSSTGELLVAEPEDLERVFAHWDGRIRVHAENQERLRERAADFRDNTDFRDETDPAIHSEVRDPAAAAIAVDQASELALEFERDLHILHLSTTDELEVLEGARRRAEQRGLDIDLTAEVCPHHLFLDTGAYETLGTRARVNPPLRAPEHRRAMVEALREGRIDFVATDHAPHTPEEKDRSYWEAPSGLPGVQTMLPLMLDAALSGMWEPEEVVDWLAHVPARLYEIEDRGRIEVGAHADLTLIDPDMEWTISADNQFSRCGWTPWEGRTVQSRPVMTFVGGTPAYRLGESGDGELLADPGLGENVSLRG